MAAPPLDPGWKAIDNFTPGIRTTISPNHPPGTAQENGTFRCYADASGALVPLPRLNLRHLPPTPPVPDPSLSSEQYRIIGLHVNNPMFWPSEASPGVDQNNTEIFMGVEYWDAPSGASTVHFVLYRYKRHYKNNPVWENVWSESNQIDYSPNIRPKHFHFQTTRSNNGAPTEAGPAVTCWAVNGHTAMFPDDTATTTNSTRYLPGDTTNDPINLTSIGAFVSVDSLVGHQGRIVFFPLTLIASGDETIFTTNEAFYYSEVNDARTLDASLSGNHFKIVAGYENPNGYGVWASLTANELLLIKTRGGALMIRGDLDDPSQVSTLPYVRSTGLSNNVGTRSPLGYLYPVDGSGVWLWKGGDQSQHITRNTMSPDFWRPPATVPATIAYASGEERTDAGWGYGWTQCADWNEWVLWPNNWLLDTDADSPDNPGGSWWRIDSTDDTEGGYVIHQWAVNWRGTEAYGTPSGYRDGSEWALYEFSIQQPSSAFRWRSQPLRESYAAQTKIEAVGIVATGRGRVNVTVRSSQDLVGKAFDFVIDDLEHPTLLQLPCGVEGTHITFDIDSRADIEGEPAPSVHALPYLPSANNLPIPLSIRP